MERGARGARQQTDGTAALRAPRRTLADVAPVYDSALVAPAAVSAGTKLADIYERSRVRA